MSFPLEPGAALAVFALVAIGSCIQASVGFGLGLIAAPLLFLIYPPLVPGPLMASSVALTLLIAFREREAIDFAGLGFAFAGRIVGTLVAALVWITLPSENFDFVFAGLVLLGVALSLSSLRIDPNPATGECGWRPIGLHGDPFVDWWPTDGFALPAGKRASHQGHAFGPLRDRSARFTRGAGRGRPVRASGNHPLDLAGTGDPRGIRSFALGSRIRRPRRGETLRAGALHSRGAWHSLPGSPLNPTP